MYKIDRITTKDGSDKTNEADLKRKGCTVNLYQLELGYSMILDYIKDNEGNYKSGFIRTSVVNDYDNCGDGFVVYTENSIYYLKKI